MFDKFRLHCTGTKLIESLVHGAPNDHECNSQQLQADLSATGTTDPTQHRLSLPKLEILAVDADETPLEKWEAEDDVKGGPLDPREVKATRQKEIQNMWYMEVYGYSTEAEARARTGRNQVGLKWMNTNKGSAEAPRYHSRFGVYGSAPQRGRADLIGNPSAGNSTNPILCYVPGRRFSS